MPTFTVNVTKDQQVATVTANKDMTVTVDLTGVDFSVYFIINNGGARKILHGTIGSFDVLKGDVVDAKAVGTGPITITTT